MSGGTLRAAPDGRTTGAWLDYFEHRGEAARGVVGTLKTLPMLHSPQLDNERDLLVYLPPSYEETERRYPVLYMHDGQNLFDASTSFSGEWEVDQTMEAMSGQGIEAIVVGIPNSGKERNAEYSPFADEKLGQEPRGDAYLSFITDTVKPIVDADFRTLPGKDCTGIAGSSLGALISLYGFFSRPEVFGFAGVLSPSIWVADRRILDYVAGAAFSPGRIYLDVGVLEGERTVLNVDRLRDILEAKGYRRGSELRYMVDDNAGHNEAAWRDHFRRSLGFLLDCDEAAAMP